MEALSLHARSTAEALNFQAKLLPTFWISHRISKRSLRLRYGIPKAEASEFQPKSKAEASNSQAKAMAAEALNFQAKSKADASNNQEKSKMDA